MRKVALLVTISVNFDDYSEIVNVCEAMQEDKETWVEFLRHLVSQSLSGFQLIFSDKCLRLVEAVHQCLPNAGGRHWGTLKRPRKRPEA